VPLDEELVRLRGVAQITRGRTVAWSVGAGTSRAGLLSKNPDGLSKNPA
jgi:hypothetical protein